VFIEAPSAGPQVERHIRQTLRRFARFAEAAARPYLPAGLPDKAVRFGAVSLVGAIERLMIEWQDGELGLSVQEIIDYLVELLLGAGLVAERSGTAAAPSVAEQKWTSTTKVRRRSR
jgi:hypothetical protein